MKKNFSNLKLKKKNCFIKKNKISIKEKQKQNNNSMIDRGEIIAYTCISISLSNV